MARVQDIVQNRVLFYVDEGATVAEVAQRMADVHVGAILVLEKGQLRGVFSERDVMLRVVLQRLNPETTSVRVVMTTQLATIDESATVEQAMESMHEHNCRHLPVTREGDVVGFLSMRDLMDYLLARKSEELDHMKAYIHGT